MPLEISIVSTMYWSRQFLTDFLLTNRAEVADHRAGEFPASVSDKILFLFRLVLNPRVIGGFLAASLTWSSDDKAGAEPWLPFMSLNFVFVLVLSNLIFQEAITMPKLFGLGLIILGIAVGSLG